LPESGLLQGQMIPSVDKKSIPDEHIYFIVVKTLIMRSTLNKILNVQYSIADCMFNIVQQTLKNLFILINRNFMPTG
jgi:hypothetical protein